MGKNRASAMLLSVHEPLGLLIDNALYSVPQNGIIFTTEARRSQRKARRYKCMLKIPAKRGSQC